MPEPRIVRTHVTRASPPASRARPAPGPGRSPAPARKGQPVLWGVLFLLGGMALWSSISRRGEDETVSEVWRESGGPDAPAPQLQSAARRGGPHQSELLRLEWPEHPRAEGYRIRFRDAQGNGPAPVPVQGTVFLYDLASDVLHLPGEFTWEVIAVLPDGSEVITPPRRYPPHD